MPRDDIYRERVLTCPFCMNPVEDPEPIEPPQGETVYGGSCPCGASFVMDRTGHNQGEAFMDAIVMAYGWDYDLALHSGARYEEQAVRYHSGARKFVAEAGGRLDRGARYFFIRPRRPDGEGS